jgi:hypothetical protein
MSKPNKGFLKEIPKAKKVESNKKFDYSSPLITPKSLKPVSFKANSREHKPTSTLTKEQNIQRGKHGK